MWHTQAFCYLIVIKNRSNNKILVDKKRLIIHINFRFIFGISQGSNFEKAPFKLTKDYITIMLNKQ